MQAHPLIFTVTLLVFEDHDEALAAGERISRLKRDLGLPSHFEFHFTKVKASFRRAFLKAIARYEFFYFTIVINRSTKPSCMAKAFVSPIRFTSTPAAWSSGRPNLTCVTRSW